jgi:hypothetical protein
MTNTLSFPSPYITLSLLHSLHPQKHLNGTLQGVIRKALLLFQKGVIRGALLFCFKKSQKERLLALEGHSAEPPLFKRSHKGKHYCCFKKSHKEKLFQNSQNTDCFYSKHRIVFKFCHIYSIKTISNGLHILKGVIRRGLFLTKTQHLI